MAQRPTPRSRTVADFQQRLTADQDVNYHMGRGASNLLLWFVVLTLIFWALLYFFNPKLVQKNGVDGRPTGQQDVAKSLLGGLLIALFLILLIWLFRSCK